MRKIFASLFFLSFISFVSAQEKLDTAIINKIKEEGTRNSKVMDIAFHLTDVNGPRLSGSPGLFKASNWAKDEMTKWGLVNANLEPWGEFGKGWELQKSYVAMTAPYYKPLIAFPKTWTKGTDGLKNAGILLIKAKDSVELENYRGKFKGKIILLYRNDTLKQSFKADATRYTGDELDKMANEQQRQRSTDTVELRRRQAEFIRRRGPQIASNIKEMALQEGAIAVLSMSRVDMMEPCSFRVEEVMMQSLLKAFPISCWLWRII